MSEIHSVKCLQQFFQDVIDGKKPFELRRNDRNYQVGDTVILHEVKDIDPSVYTGREFRFRISYFIQDSTWLKEGVCAIGMERPPSANVNDQVNKLVEALEDANELCRSAYQIADNICEEYGSPSFGVNFEAFRDRLKESLSRQQQALEQAKRGDAMSEETEAEKAKKEFIKESDNLYLRLWFGLTENNTSEKRGGS